MEIILISRKTGYLYELIKLEKDLKNRANPNFGEDTAYLKRLGDGKPLEICYKKVDTLFGPLIKEEVSRVQRYLSDLTNPHKCPVKISQGTITLGPETHSWKNSRGVTADPEEAKSESVGVPELLAKVRKDLSVLSKIVNDFPLSEEITTKNKDKKNKENKSLGILITPSLSDSFNNIVLNKNVKDSIIQGVAKIELKDFLDNTWGLNQIDPQSGRSILNFYGPPGTGKTKSAKAVAQKLNLNLLQVDYAQVESMWVGQTGKNIKSCFENAKTNNAILFFDEADSLVCRRNPNSDNANQNHANQNLNIFMQELDKFEGVVILTTNLFENYDPALLRRISQHVEFILPSSEQRADILRQHIPLQVPLAADMDFNQIAQNMNGFSGGDIKNVATQALIGAANEAKTLNQLKEAKLTRRFIDQEIDNILKTKQKHDPYSFKKKIGF